MKEDAPAKTFGRGRTVRLTGEHLRPHLKGRAGVVLRRSLVAPRVVILGVTGAGVVSVCDDEIEHDAEAAR